MPLPKPNESETKYEWTKRCMSDETMNKEFPDDDQRYAVCMEQFGEDKEMD